MTLSNKSNEIHNKNAVFSQLPVISALHFVPAFQNHSDSTRYSGIFILRLLKLIKNLVVLKTVLIFVTTAQK